MSGASVQLDLLAEIDNPARREAIAHLDAVRRACPSPRGWTEARLEVRALDRLASMEPLSEPMRHRRDALAGWESLHRYITDSAQGGGVALLEVEVGARVVHGWQVENPTGTLPGDPVKADRRHALNVATLVVSRCLGDREPYRARWNDAQSIAKRIIDTCPVWPARQRTA